ncbi:KilA-N domain-containing protein [Haemophilus sp. SZY H35]|uniref:KilA-N domain-containing protein n=1 Tax=Haemophilus sp. SZY H35 TaxID=2839967 RepID=UPI001C04931C|nr:KilA-N domain-containing protein [Haemophilus sp. SZY H35]
MSNLTILKTSIRSYENLFSLNDLHIASGGLEKHRPSLFARNEQTKELIKEIENDRSTKTIFALKTIRGGSDISKQGTWACEELVLSYAMWISPKFHLIVLRAFLAMHRNQAQQLELSKTKGKKQRGLLPPKNPFGYMTYEREFTAHELEWLVLSWYQAYEYRELLKQLFPMLEAAQSALLTPIKNRIASSDMDFKLSADVLFRITRGTDVMHLAPLITLENYVQ